MKKCPLHDSPKSGVALDKENNIIRSDPEFIRICEECELPECAEIAREVGLKERK